VLLTELSIELQMFFSCRARRLAKDFIPSVEIDGFLKKNFASLDG
jgi:hypothetical protein